MRRHPALHDLSRDHFFALECARQVRLACESGSAEHRREAAQALLHLWEADLQFHFREEEEILLPLLSRHLEIMDEPALRRMLEDHAWLRDRVPRVTGEDAQRLAAVGSRLHDHARLEEREVFPLLERVLSEADLDECAARSEEFRRRHRGPEGLGPRREGP